uniref:Uncharacterized protein n=1 Tax=Sphaerodactylus townsendi TaxID=933632 RepID=A0ACB8FET5_9SAUR
MYDNKLLEKSYLLSIYKLQVESLDLHLGLSTRSALDLADSIGDEVLGSADALERLRRNYTGHVLELRRINIELTCKMIERNMMLEAKETALVEQRARCSNV